MTCLKRRLTAAITALVFALPASPQTGGTSGVLQPPGQLFAAPAGKFQTLYNDASQCSGLSAQVQASAGVYAARTLTESTRARRAGDELSATNLQALFTNGTTIRDAASSAHTSLEALRAELARRSDVNDAGGRILYMAGGRGVSPLRLDSLPPSGPALVDALLVKGIGLVGDLEKAEACLSAIGAVDVSRP